MNIIEMARQARFFVADNEVYSPSNQADHELTEFVKAFAALVAAHEREACVKACKKLLKVFLSPQYATGQPLSSFKERHAVASCVEAIEARGTI
jgi:hypothetical protein